MGEGYESVSIDPIRRLPEPGPASPQEKRELEDVRDELLKLVRRLNWTVGPSPEGARRSTGSRKEGSLPRLAVPSTQGSAPLTGRL